MFVDQIIVRGAGVLAIVGGIIFLLLVSLKSGIIWFLLASSF
ncbi:hypothetical protein [Sulfobacillus thermosulfidooxidans]|nr:hypothetical protein [Sulfobacillus thermosulfidooxidans]